MPQTISIEDVVFAMDVQADDATSYLDPDSGEILVLTEEEERLLDLDEEPDEPLPEWETELVPKLRDITESGRWLSLPDRFDIHEWAIMEAFCDTVTIEQVRLELREAIAGNGAFRMFGTVCERRRLRDAWLDFRDEALTRIARDWLDSKSLRYD